jgi:hypothetical protein
VLNRVVLPSAVWIGGERMEQTAPS